MPDRNGLIVEHMGYARQLAARYEGRGLDLDELRAEAYAGLVDAASGYDPKSHPDSSFAGYARLFIKGRILKALKRSPICPLARTDTEVDRLGVMDGAGDRESLLHLVEEVIELCTPIGRAMLRLVAIDELSVGQAARRLAITRREAQSEHDEACLTVAREFKRLGWTETSWLSAIA